MKINILVKQAGKKRCLARLPFEIPNEPLSADCFISAVVRKNVSDFNAKKTDSNVVGILTEQNINEQADLGKVGFGRKFTGGIGIDIDAETACETALQAFEDGLYRIFIDDSEVCDLNESLNLREGCSVSFIRFTFLAGRMW